jgi:tetraacyldisaccharide 4'-kinase
MPNLYPPEFWSRGGWVPSLLSPVAHAYAAMGAARRAWTASYRASVPVICVGNLTLGGAGKTPIVESLARLFTARGRSPHILTRGYGGSAAGPLRVDPARHGADEVGDEALLLARVAPVWVARDRAAGARAAVKAGALRLLLDDGFQNPTLAKDVSLLAIDGVYGFGNGRVIPAGPLREPAPVGLARADAVVVIGEDRAGIAQHLAVPMLRAELAPINAADFAGRRVLAFAGIGRPEKFFASLEGAGATLAARHAFPDHHRYRPSELGKLADEASALSAALVTTEKDSVRLPPAWRARVETLAVAIQWRDEVALRRLLAAVLDDG